MFRYLCSEAVNDFSSKDFDNYINVEGLCYGVEHIEKFYESEWGKILGLRDFNKLISDRTVSSRVWSKDEIADVDDELGFQLTPMYKFSETSLVVYVWLEAVGGGDGLVAGKLIDYLFDHVIVHKKRITPTEQGQVQYLYANRDIILQAEGICWDILQDAAIAKGFTEPLDIAKYCGKLGKLADVEKPVQQSLAELKKHMNAYIPKSSESKQSLEKSLDNLYEKLLEGIK